MNLPSKPLTFAKLSADNIAILIAEPLHKLMGNSGTASDRANDLGKTAERASLKLSPLVADLTLGN
jgi:hypothetical protein